MILGIGTDCVQIERIKKLLGQFDEKAIQRLFTETEIKIKYNKYHGNQCHYTGIRHKICKAVT